MRGTDGYLIEVAFLNKDRSFQSDKVYHYFISRDLIKELHLLWDTNPLFVDKLNPPLIATIENDRGYTYHDAEIAILNLTYIPSYDWKNLVIKQSSFREIVRIEVQGALIEFIGKIPNSQLKPWEGERKKFIDLDILQIENEEAKCETVITSNVSDILNSSNTIRTNQCNNTTSDIFYADFINSNKTNQCNNATNDWFTGDFINTITTNVPDVFKPNPISLNNQEVCIVNSKNNEKEGKTMNSFDKIFKFGRADNVKMSIYGPAFQSGDGWISRNEGEWVDVTDLLIDIGNTAFCFMMPVAKSDVSEGDFILHQNKWVYVSQVCETFLEVEKMGEQEIVNVLPVRNPFGFEFYTKLITPFENGFMGANETNPFGMLPMLMAMGDSKNKDNSMLPLMMMMSGNGSMNMDMFNPMMLMLMCGDSKDSMIPLMSMFMCKQSAQNAGSK